MQQMQRMTQGMGKCSTRGRIANKYPRNWVLCDTSSWGIVILPIFSIVQVYLPRNLFSYSIPLARYLTKASSFPIWKSLCSGYCIYCNEVVSSNNKLPHISFNCKRQTISLKHRLNKTRMNFHASFKR